MAATLKTYMESDGKSVTVTLTAAITKGDIVQVNGWTGWAFNSGISGDSVALNIERGVEYQFQIPDALNPAIGDTVYITLASVVGHSIPDTALSTTSGAGKKALFKCSTVRYGAAGAYWINGMFLPEGL